MVAVTTRARVESSSSPRCFVRRNEEPSRAFEAVAPSSTSASGFTSLSSSSSHGLQASISNRLGVWWMRRLPRSSNLKCFTTLVM